MRGGVVRVERDRAPQQLARLDDAGARRALQRRTRAQQAVVGVEACGRFRRDALLLELGDPDRQRAGDLARDAILQREHVGGRLVETRRPQHAALESTICALTRT